MPNQSKLVQAYDKIRAGLTELGFTVDDPQPAGLGVLGVRVLDQDRQAFFRIQSEYSHVLGGVRTSIDFKSPIWIELTLSTAP